MLLNSYNQPLPDTRLSILVLCTGNSARSILAECLFNTLGNQYFVAYSAGSHPAGQVNPYALSLLQEQQVETQPLRSKSWDEFIGPEAPELDFVIGVCSNATALCPVFPGTYTTIHWSLPDPAKASTPEQARQDFAACWATLQGRVEQLVKLPLDNLSKAEIGKRMQALDSWYAPSESRHCSLFS